jgi:uncharacterized protein
MMHPATQLKFVSPEIGFGVFATQDIPKGTITYAIDSLELQINELTYQNLPDLQKEKVDWFSYRDEKNNRIVSWDHAKYVNHCCHANTLTTAWGFEIAVRDIKEGEEITDDYGLFMGVEESMTLKCNKSDCRGMVGYGDHSICGPEWDRKIKEALALVNYTSQPLLTFLPEDVKHELLQFTNGRVEYKGISSLYI